MEKDDYVKALREQVNEEFFMNEDDSITWSSFYINNGFQQAVSYTRKTDFSKDSLEKDIEFFKKLIVSFNQFLNNLVDSVVIAELS